MAKHHALALAVTSRQPGRVRPGQEVAAGVGLPAVGPGRRLVEGEPPVEPGQPGVPRERRVVAVAHPDHSPGTSHPSHLPQCGDRVGDVLEDLVGVHHVERVVGQVEGMHVRDAHLGVGHALTLELGPRQRGRILTHLDRDDPAPAGPGRR